MVAINTEFNPDDHHDCVQNDHDEPDIVGANLEDVVEHGGGVAVVGLSLAGGQLDQTSPGVAQVTAVSPGQLVLVILHLDTNCRKWPHYCIIASVPCTRIRDYWGFGFWDWK